MHGRHGLSRAWATHTASLIERTYVAVTEGDELSGATCDDAGMMVIRAPNSPLGAKFNAALAAALGDGATRIIILPSDDFVSAAWVDAARSHDTPYLYPHTCAVVDAPTQKAYRIDKLSFGTLRYGAGRVVDAAILRKMGGELWPPHLLRGLDGASHQRLLHAGVKYTIHDSGSIPITDVKTSDNLWPFSTWQHSGPPITADQALHMVSPHVRKMLDALATTH